MHRVALLTQAFEHIAATRMAGVPVLHAGLRVEAVGFAPQVDGNGAPGLLGVLVTPWFMNLVWLPTPPDAAPLAVGDKRLRCLGGEVLGFIGAQEAGCAFEACSLFSPMFEFADQDAARAVARAVMDALRAGDAVPAPGLAAPAALAAPVALAAPAALAGPVRVDAPGVPSRRGFLFGRGSAAEAAR